MSDSQPKRAKNCGQKICSSCEEVDPVGACVYKNCGTEFEMKKPRKRAHKVPVDDFKTLERGDIIHVVGESGPYYTGDDGERTYLVDRGKYKVVSTDDKGISVYGESGYGYLYMGEICPSKLLASITQAPCKILKCISRSTVAPDLFKAGLTPLPAKTGGMD